MTKIITGGIVLSLLTSCVAPINTSFESARMLRKGDFEATGNYTHYTFSNEGESEGINDNFGLRLGYGFSNNFNLKLRYEHLTPTDEESPQVNYFDLAPKFQILPGKIAGTLPVGLYFYEEEGESESEVVISPKFLFTYPANDKFEVTLAAKADIFPENEGNVYLGFNLGFGLSSNLDQWAVRPEIGLMVDPGESGIYWAYGIGLTGILPGRNSGEER